MRKLIVVTNLKEWTLSIENVEVISARQYLTDPAFQGLRNVRIFNLCKNYQYQSSGYYVSLLADARGHKVIPNTLTLQDFRSQAIVKVISAEIDELVQKSLKRIRSDQFTLSIYFGKNISSQYDELSRQLYMLFQAPLLRAQFRKGKTWTLRNMETISMKDVPPAHLEFVEAFARTYFAKLRYDIPRADHTRYDLAILVNPDESEPPSNKKALEKFVEAASDLQVYTDLITREDFSRIAEYDALFIRETTSVNHHTYRFARRAKAEGMVVIDDPESILRCTNKVYLAEILDKARVPTPQTLIIHKHNRDQVLDKLGLPCVLKKPDSAFSQGVVKVKTAVELNQQLDQMLASSDLIIGQKFLPTDFDWRIGVLDKKPLYACKYYMASGHWQIYNWKGTGKDQSGLVETIPVEEVPENIISVALRAANLIGDGLYGVDIKESGGEVFVIEVNDNPSIDAGYEDQVLQDKLYKTIIKSFINRLER